MDIDPKHTKFFTNDEGQTLLERFRESLPKNTKYFDILVAYFRISGFLEVYDKLENIKKIRILVGINTDSATIDVIETSKNNRNASLSSEEAKKTYLSKVEKFVNKKESKRIEKGIKKFIEFINEDKIEVRVYRKVPIHTKLYILRKDQEKVEDFGKVITGSSNFSYSGLTGNQEFNVELKDPQDVHFALNKFDNLWKEADAAEITEEVKEIIEEQTWMKSDISPYELYLKFLYEYFDEKRINRDKNPIEGVPEDFLKLQYQSDAAQEIIEKMNKYDGAYLADVVGLGKTYITAMVAQELNGKILVIAPPRLTDYWHKVLFNFEVPSEVRSNSYESLKNLVEKENIKKYDYLVVDEAHKFRNEDTQTYEYLERLAADKKILLVSATPLNNEPEDIGSQIYLFQDKYNSDLPGLKNLKPFFRSLQKRIDKIDRKKHPQKYKKVKRKASERIRKKVLGNLMVRRTRQDVDNHYSEDLEKRGVSFPDIKKPKSLGYNFSDHEEKVFNKTIETIKKLAFARYKPLIYLKPGKVSPKELTHQHNLKGFMHTLLVKRLDSSFKAFKKTLNRFIESYEQFIKMYEQGVILISEKIDVYDLLEADSAEEIIKKFEAEKEREQKSGKSFKADEFKPEFKTKLRSDLEELQQLKQKWDKIEGDPKINELINELSNRKLLSNLENKILIFTEAKDTAKYVGAQLKKERSITQKGAIKVMHGSSSKGDFREVEENLNPNVKDQKDKIRILVTTDALSEGVNLHKANIIINYDIPWNPTKVLQRVGRVNRVGTEHDKIHIFNFFPAEQTEEAIGLKKKAVAKIQAFHDALGEDAQYLSEEEDYSAKGIFEKVNSPEYLSSGEGEENQELKYLKEIREVRDKDYIEKEDLYQKIKRLPPRSRSAKSYSEKADNLLTYFKIGDIDKIYMTDQQEEIDFLAAAKLLKSDSSTERQKIPMEVFYELKQQNQENFSEDIKQDNTSPNHNAQSNIKKVLDNLQALLDSGKLSKEEENYIQDVKLAVEVGIGRQTLKTLKNSFADAESTRERIKGVKENIDSNLVKAKKKRAKEKRKQRKNKQVILSEYFTN